MDEGADFYPEYLEGRLDPEVGSFLLASAGPPGGAAPLRSLSPGEVRARSGLSPFTALRDEVERRTEVLVPAAGRRLALRVYEPRGEGPFPVLLYFHGGGFVFGGLDEADHLCAAFANRTPCLVVSVDYRLSPENRFPAALEDAKEALLWTFGHAAEFGGDPERIGVAGESAGANLAAVLCRLARGGPRLAFQLLLCPWTDLSSFESGSRGLFGRGPWLPLANLDYYRDQYLGNAALAADPRASPLKAEDLGGLPPAHVVTAEFDPLRDEGEAYARRLAEAGCRVTTRRYEGMIHSFFALNAAFGRADGAIADFAAALKEGLA